jgi:hypothetical protein
MRFFLFCALFIASISVNAQSPSGQDKFMENLKKHCGKAYEGTITAGGREGDGFTGQKLVMRVISCSENQVKIPFFVGENKSRTWILTQKGTGLELKHDHRHEDGTDDKVTMYGGTTSNTGSASLQFFPADQFTCDMIDYACGNVWWITLDDTKYTYNLRRIGSDRLFTVSFDLTKPIEYSEKPWGWKE